MGTRTSLAAITLSDGALAKAAACGFNATAMLTIAQNKCLEAAQVLSFLNTDILTPGGDSANASTLSTLITNLS